LISGDAVRSKTRPEIDLLPTGFAELKIITTLTVRTKYCLNLSQKIKGLKVLDARTVGLLRTGFDKEGVVSAVESVPRAGWESQA
jgi:hypothetical protein